MPFDFEIEQMMKKGSTHRSDTKVITLAVVCIAVVCFAVGYMSGSQLDVDTSYRWHSDSNKVSMFTRNDRLKSSMGVQHTKRSLTTSDGISLLTPNIHFYNEYTYVKPLAGIWKPSLTHHVIPQLTHLYSTHIFSSGDYPWENMVEPYRKTTFVVTNPATNYTYHWYINGWHKEDGITTDVNFGAPTGVLDTITVQIRNAVSGALSLTQDMKVMCKYVRRYG